jgi:hypothetical protein
MILLQEITLSLGFGFPCFLMPIFSWMHISMIIIPLNIRSWRLIVLYYPELRKGKYVFLLKPKCVRRILFISGFMTLLMGCAWIYLFPIYQNLLGGYECYCLREWYVYIPLSFIPSVAGGIIARNYLKTMTDIYKIGREYRFNILIVTPTNLAYMTMVIVMQYVDIDWNNIQQRGISIQYILVITLAILSISQCMATVIYYNNSKIKQNQIQPYFHTISCSVDSNTSKIIPSISPMSHVPSRHMRVSSSKINKLLDVLNNDELLVSFTEYTRKCLCVETIYFWKDANNALTNHSLKIMTPSEYNKLRDELRHINETYIVPDAHYEINLSYALKNKFKLAVEELKEYTNDNGIHSHSIINRCIKNLTELQIRIVELMQLNLITPFLADLETDTVPV